MKFKEFFIILLVVIVTIGMMYFIQVLLPKYMKGEEACYRVYLKK